MESKRYIIDRHWLYASILIVFMSVYPPNNSSSQVNKVKVKPKEVVPIIISPYDQAADAIQAKITHKRNDTDMDLREIVSQLNKKLAQRPKVYILSKPKIIHDTVFYVVPQAETETDYFQKTEIQPRICTDTVYITEKRGNLFQRIFSNKKKN